MQYLSFVAYLFLQMWKILCCYISLEIAILHSLLPIFNVQLITIQQFFSLIFYGSVSESCCWSNVKLIKFIYLFFNTHPHILLYMETSLINSYLMLQEPNEIIRYRIINIVFVLHVGTATIKLQWRMVGASQLHQKMIWVTSILYSSDSLFRERATHWE